MKATPEDAAAVDVGNNTDDAVSPKPGGQQSPADSPICATIEGHWLATRVLQFCLTPSRSQFSAKYSKVVNSMQQVSKFVQRENTASNRPTPKGLPGSILLRICSRS